jgi:uncharacterized protein
MLKSPALIPDACRPLLEEQTVGRLGFLVGGRLEIVPVNYLLDGDDVVVRSRAGGPLDAARVQSVVFEVDAVDADTTGSSVLVRGVARAVTDEDEVERLMLHPARTWSRMTGDRYVRISVEAASARQLRQGTAHPTEEGLGQLWLG